MNREAINIVNANEGQDDSSLIRSFQKGNRESFDLLVMRYQDRIFNICHRFLGDHQEAEDLSQDIFVKVFRSLGRFRFESSFYTWLYRIAVNSCKNRVRSSSFKKAGKNLSLDHDLGTELAGKGDEKDNPSVYLEKKEQSRKIQEALNDLHPGQRAMIILRDIEGMSYEEIAGVTGKRLGTVKSGLSRARLMLNKRLEGVL